MRKNEPFSRVVVTTLIFMVTVQFYAEQAQAKKHSKPDTVQSKVGGFFGRVLHEHKKYHVTVMGQKKSYTGFPPREVIDKGTDRFDDLNLFVDVPDYPWMCTMPKSKTSRSSLHFKRSKPKLEVFLDVDPASSRLGRTVLERSQNRVRRDFNCKLSSNSSEAEAAGFHGVIYNAYLGTVRNKKKQYLVWAATYDGRDYQLTVAGKPGATQEIEATLNEFLTRFRPIEPVKEARYREQKKQAIRKVGTTQRLSTKNSKQVRWASDQN